MSYYKWKPSKKAIQNFKNAMNEIDDFCNENNIIQSRTSDSYYFFVNGQKYRVSNHSVESSPKYHDGRESDTIYIHAGKTRIIQIYNDIVNGFQLDGRGNRK